MFSIQSVSQTLRKATKRSSESHGDRKAKDDFNVAEAVAHPPLCPVVGWPDDPVDEHYQVDDYDDDHHAAGGDVLNAVEGAEG